MFDAGWLPILAVSAHGEALAHCFWDNATVMYCIKYSVDFLFDQIATHDVTLGTSHVQERG